jgi:hypothetical protein
MKESFEENLNKFGKLAKERHTAGITDYPSGEELHKRQEDVERLATKIAKETSTKIKYQRRIYKLQLEKQKIMLELKEKIKKIDNPDYKVEKLKNQREVVSVDNGDMYLLDDSGYKGEKIDFGEILTDGEWGVDYFLDPKTVSRNFRKRYEIEKARSQIRSLLYVQFNNMGLTGGDINYKFLLEAFKNNVKLEYLKNADTFYGIIAEIMVKNFFKKLAFNSNLNIKVIDTDPEQDREKIDFIIERQNKNRGVQIETHSNFGIQFTIGGRSVLSKKRSEINEFKQVVARRYNLSDLLLVSLPKEIISKSFHAWQDGGKKPGGPDKFLSLEDKENIFRSVLYGILSPEEINEKWSNVGYELRNEKQTAFDKNDLKPTNTSNNDESGDSHINLSEYNIKTESQRQSKYATKRALKFEPVTESIMTSEPSQITQDNIKNEDERKKVLTKEPYNWPAELEFLEKTISVSGLAGLKRNLGTNPDIKVEKTLQQIYRKVVNHYWYMSKSPVYPIPYEQWRDMILENLQYDKPKQKESNNKEPKKKSVAAQWGFR